MNKTKCDCWIDEDTEHARPYCDCEKCYGIGYINNPKDDSSSMIIFSLDTSEYTAKNADIQDLNDSIPDLVQVEGMYKGTKERSFVADPNQLREVLEVARRYGQESVLLVRPNSVSLYYVDSKEEVNIGDAFAKVTKEEAEAQGAYTKMNGFYYIVR